MCALCWHIPAVDQPSEPVHNISIESIARIFEAATDAPDPGIKSASEAIYTIEDSGAVYTTPRQAE